MCVGNANLSWDRASHEDLESYKYYVLDKLRRCIDVPVSALYCKEVLCNCVQHRNDLNVFCDAITNVLIDSASCTVPNHRAKDKQKPYWRELAQCNRKRALLWHSIWKDMGCPQDGDVADIRRKTRATYHKVIRSITKIM